MASVRSLKRRLSSASLIDKYKALKEIEEGQSCIATSRKYGVAKNTISHWIKQKQKIFEAVEENNVSKKRKWVKPTTYEELDNATCKWLKSARDLPRFRWLDGPMEKTIQCQFQNYISYILVYKAGI